MPPAGLEPAPRGLKGRTDLSIFSHCEGDYRASEGQRECRREGNWNFATPICGVFFFFARGQEYVEPIAGALQLARENLGVAAKGDWSRPEEALRDLVAHHHRGDFRAYARVVEPGRGRMARVLQADRLGGLAIAALATDGQGATGAMTSMHPLVEGPGVDVAPGPPLGTTLLHGFRIPPRPRPFKGQIRSSSDAPGS